MSSFSLSSELSNALLRLIAQDSQIKPTVEPTIEPTVESTIELAVEPTIEPTVEPTIEPLSKIRGNRCTLFDHNTLAVAVIHTIAIQFFAIHSIAHTSMHK
jgi:hypothetical protein